MSGFIDEFSNTRNVIGKEAICPTSEGFSPLKEIKTISQTQVGI